MFIIAPISRVSEVRSVIEAGANELYCGLLTDSQLDKYANINCFNRRAEVSSNLFTYNELEEVIRIAHLRNISVSFTLNEFYNQKQISAVLIQLEKAIDCGIDAVIVSDIGLLCKIKEKKYSHLKIHVSSCATILNSDTVQFYKMFNPSRIILNRQLTFSEIQNMQQSSPELDMEVFILNERCYNIDGLCTFLHGRLSPGYNFLSRFALNKTVDKNIEHVPRFILSALHRYVVKNSLSCCFSYSGQYELIKNEIRKEVLPNEKIIFNDPRLFLEACGLCVIYDFYRMGVKFLKISGRSLLASKIMDVYLVREAINILQEEPVKSNFCRKIRHLVRNKYHRTCSPEYCYYCDAALM